MLLIIYFAVMIIVVVLLILVNACRQSWSLFYRILSTCNNLSQICATGNNSSLKICEIDYYHISVPIDINVVKHCCL